MVVEIPLADADAAYAVLGGMPDPGHERWVAVAALQSAEESAPRQIESKRAAGAKPSRNWNELQPQQQAGIRCGEPSFVAFLKEQRSDDWYESADDPAACVRLICGIESRAMLGVNQKARVIWKQLNDQYEAWKQVEHA